jgi:hypothetical protein
VDRGVDDVKDVGLDSHVSLSSDSLAITSIRCQDGIYLRAGRHPQDLPPRRSSGVLQGVGILRHISLTGRLVASMIRVLPGTIITFLVYENVNRAFEMRS